MQKHSFQEILEYEKLLKKLYADHGLIINSNSRILEYFSKLRQIEEHRQKPELNALLDSNKTKYYFSLFHTYELKEIIDALNSIETNIDLVKEKLKIITKGGYLLSEENLENSNARNTTFELSLLSFLKKIGGNVNFGDINPDLILKTKFYSYNIECKRPLNHKSVDKNISKALKQLRKKSVPKGIPVVAISLDRVILGDNLILHSKSVKSALTSLNNLLTNYAIENKPSLDRICSNNSCVVIYYLSCLTGFATDKLPFSYTTYAVGNIYNFDNTGVYDDLVLLTGMDLP